MNLFLKSAISAVLSLSLAVPVGTFGTSAQAQGEVSECGKKFNPAALPCRIGGNVALSEKEWRLLNLIRNGKAKTLDEAKAIMAKRRADRQKKTDGERLCSEVSKEVQLPCTVAGKRVETKEEWRVMVLIARGEAKNVRQARQMLKDRRAAGQARQNAQKPQLKRCSETSKNLVLPCEVAGRAVDTKDGWRIFTLIERGEAATVKEAKALVRQMREGPQVAACSETSKGLNLPCRIGDQQVDNKDDWRVYTLIARGEAESVRQARRLVAQMRAAANGGNSSDAPSASQLEAEAREAAAKAERRAKRRAERRAERQAAAAAAAAASGNSSTETVTTSSLRTSDQEFETQDKDGLSSFEKVLLLGLGAVVVGSVLKNGDKVVSRSGDRVVVQGPDGDLRVLKDDEALVRRPGDSVETQNFDDGSTRIIVSKPDGTKVITVRGRDGSVLRRVNVDRQGNQVVIIDDTVEEREVILRELPSIVRQTAMAGGQSEDALRSALAAQAGQGRQFSLRQVREIGEVRALVPELELDAVRFASGSAAIHPAQARALANLGGTLRRLVAEDPQTVLLIEGHTDATGSALYNLALSDRRAETVALALTEYFDVPPANLVTQGYGETALKVPTLASEAQNRRAVVRNITGLLR